MFQHAVYFHDWHDGLSVGLKYVSFENTCGEITLPVEKLKLWKTKENTR